MIRRIMTTWHFGHVCAVLMEFEDFYTVVKIGATESQIKKSPNYWPCEEGGSS